MNRAGKRLNDTQSGAGRFIRNAIIEDDNYHYYTDPNGFGNIIQRTNKATKVNRSMTTGQMASSESSRSMKWFPTPRRP